MTTDFLKDYYESYSEEERLSSRWGQVEFLTTMRYINRYMKPGMRILDIGAGTGKYSLEIAKTGNKVDAIELVKHNIEIFEDKIENQDNISVRQGNALDLSLIKDKSYDMTLLMGPMYHLYTKDDKLKALSEAIRVTRPGGIIFIAYCISDASVIDFGFRRGNIMSLIERDMLNLDTFDTFSAPVDLFELVRKKDIDALMTGFNTERLHYVATDGYTRHMKETIEAMDETIFNTYLKYHFATCENEDMVGITHHSLDIIRKI